MSESVRDDAAFERMLRSLIDHEEEFRELDAAAGDGDLGITVRSAAAAILDWLPQNETAATTSQLLAGVAQVCASTSPSTFGSLISRGLAAAARALGNEQRDDLTSMVVALEAGIHMVQRLGGAEPGEKTFLDALMPALEVARGATSVTQALPLMCAAAIAGTEQTVAVVPKHGRAAWVGERASGIPDAGSVVVIRALEAFAGADAQPWDVGLSAALSPEREHLASPGQSARKSEQPDPLPGVIPPTAHHRE
jgi:dihydroxyacetone kinase